MILDQIIIFLLQIFFAFASILFQNQISIGVVGNPKSFLPHEAKSDSEKMVSDLLFRKLFKYEEGELVNDIADSWNSNEEDTEYHIKIKKGLTWQDGKSINADDVIYSLTLYENIISDLEIQKLSDYEILIKLQTPNAILPTILTIGIEPSHLSGKFQTSPIASSSYRVARVTREQDKIESVELISFVSNKTYNKINVRFYSNDNQLISAYKLAEINVFMSELEFSWEGLQKTSITFLGRYYGILFNTQNNKLEDQDIRQKLTQSLNIDALLKRPYFSNAKATQGPISYSQYTKDAFKFPLYSSKTELTQTQKNKIDEMNILLPNTKDGAQLQSYLNEQWETKLGIKLKFEYLEMEELIKRATDSSFDIIFLGFEVSPDPDRYNFWHSTQIGSLNLSKFIDLRADKSLEEGRLEYSFDKRKEHYDIFQDVMITKNPAVFLYHPGKYLYSSIKKPLSVPGKVYYPADIVKNF